MANVSLKTDFKDGDILYDYHLNNNFAAIQAALGAMNKIVWQDNADAVVTFRGTTEELAEREIINGQILYDTTTGESYIDYDGARISTGSGNVISIGDDEPTNPATQLWIETDSLDSRGTEVINEYSESTSLAYSANYVNNKITEELLPSFQGLHPTNKTYQGEPVYEIALTFPLLTSSENVEINIPDFVYETYGAYVSDIVGYSAKCRPTTDTLKTVRKIPFYANFNNTDYWITVWISAGILYANCSAAYTGEYCTVVVEVTID